MRPAIDVGNSVSRVGGSAQTKAMKQVEEEQGKAPRYDQDLRRVMDDKTIDIITIAMPNHWHAITPQIQL